MVLAWTRLLERDTRGWICRMGNLDLGVSVLFYYSAWKWGLRRNWDILCEVVSGEMQKDGD